MSNRRQGAAGSGTSANTAEEERNVLLRKVILPPNPKESFPARLHQMLTDIELLSSKDDSMRKLRDYVSWLDHGKSFKIHNKRQFENVV